jgi:hypothetical protein
MSSPLLFFKRLSDVWEEEYQNAIEETGDESYARATANDRFAIPVDAHWSDVRNASRDVGRALLNAFRAIEAANPERLSGVFGNASWTDKAQLPDETLKNLIEHFSSHSLSLAAVPEDELGNGYEYLIKQFADDSGHTAQEFYTNRTLVHLMTQMLEPQPGERIYDPTVGTGGMLISALAEVKRRGGDARTIGLYGQELIHITAAIARMNLVLHGVEDFQIIAGNTLSSPAFIERDHLQTFDVVLANPPYSIKKWNREAWRDDAWGRNFLARRHRAGLIMRSSNPHEEQRLITRVLQAVDSLKSALVESCRLAEVVVTTKREHQIGRYQPMERSQSRSRSCSAASWSQVKLGDCADLEMGFAFKSAWFCNSGVQLLRMGNIRDGRLNLDSDPVFLPEEIANEYSEYRLRAGDIVMSMTGTVGKRDYRFTLTIPNGCPPLLLNQRICRIRSRGDVTQFFLGEIVRTEAFLRQIYSIASGNKQANLSAKSLYNTVVSFPIMERQESIGRSLRKVSLGNQMLHDRFKEARSLATCGIRLLFPPEQSVNTERNV